MRRVHLIILLLLQPLVISCGGGNGDSPQGIATPPDPIADITAPTVSIISPNSGSTYSSAQTVTLTASASDDVGVTRVDFLKDGTVMDSDTTNAYSTTWSVSEAVNGTHSWTARAYDAAGNLKVSSAVTLTVDITPPDTTAPTVSITSPASGSTYTSAQTVAINAAASDNVGVTQVRFYDGSSWRGTDTSAPYSYNWAVSETANGTHSWTARAYDAAGNLKVSSAVSLTVDITAPDTTAPTVSITSPGSGSTYSSAQTVTLTASASDNVGVTRVDFLKDGTVMATDTTNAYSTTWTVSEADNGAHSWTARAYDAAGNLKVSSAVSLTVDIGTSTGDAGEHIWSLGIGGPNGVDSATSKAVATDNNGSVMIAGDFTRTINLGGASLTSTGSTDIFLAKYLSDGALQWSRGFGHSTAEVLLGGDMNGAGDMVVAGYFMNSAEFGGPAFTSAGGSDIFIAKYAANGTHLWSKRLGSTNNDRGYAVAIAANGDVAVTGYFSGTVDFGGGPLSSAGAADTFIAKYSSNGAHRWSVRAGGTSSDIGTAIAIDDASGEVVVSGYYAGSASFGGATLNSAGSNDVFAAKYSANGAHLWSKRFGSTSDDRGKGVAIDQAGDVILTGNFYGAASFGGATLTSAGASDLFLARFAPNGAHRWSKRLGSDDPSFGDNVSALCVDLSGNITVTGKVFDSVDFGGGWLWGNATYDSFIVNFSPNGTHQWSKRAGDSFTDNGTAVAADLNGNVLATGTFYTAADLGGATLTSPGGISSYLGKFAP